MALTWEKLKEFGNIVKRTSVPTVADCTFGAITIWVNTVTDIGYLINGTTITPLPVTVGGSAPATGASVATMQAEIDALQSDMDKKIDSIPTAGQYKINELALDANKKVVVIHKDTVE
jgi:hypothetical protein